MKLIRSASLIMSFLLVCVCLWPVSSAIADDPRAREIMEKVDARDDGDNRTADMEMILIDKRGNLRRSFHFDVLYKGIHVQCIQDWEEDRSLGASM